MRNCGVTIVGNTKVYITSIATIVVATCLLGKTHFHSISQCYNLFEFMLLGLYMNLLVVYFLGL